MVASEQWGDHPEWLGWVGEVWQENRGRVQQQYPHDPHPCRAAFADRATLAFRQKGVPVRWLKTWVSVQLPEDGEGYADEYPHVHYPLDGTTLVHYLQTGAEPAVLDIFDGDDVIETVVPTVGLTVFMPNDLRHGVRKHHDPVNRVQVIATALR